MTAYNTIDKLSSLSHKTVGRFGDNQFSTAAAAAETIVGIWDISTLKHIDISVHHLAVGANAATVHIWISNQRLPPSTTLATMKKQCDCISGAGVAVATDTTVDIMFVVNNQVASDCLNNARWLVITASSVVATENISVDCEGST